MVGKAEPGVVAIGAKEGLSSVVFEFNIVCGVDWGNVGSTVGKLFAKLITIRDRVVGISGLFEAGINDDGNVFSCDRIFGFLFIWSTDVVGWMRWSNKFCPD